MFGGRITGKEMWVWRWLMTSVPDFSGTKLCQASKQELSEPTNFLQGAEKANLVQKWEEGKEKPWGFLERLPNVR